MSPSWNRRESPQVMRRRGPGWIAASLLLLVTAFGGLAAGFAGGERVLTSWGLLPAPEPSASASPTATPTPGLSLVPRLRDTKNVLFMATDVEYSYQNGRRVMGLRGRTDTMLLVRLDPHGNQVRMLSIPRDTRVDIPGRGPNKINAANPYGGPELATRVVSDLLGVPVDRYLLVNTRGVIQLVDALGGVNVFVPKDLNYDDWTGGLHIHLAKGWNQLDGKKSHDFLRFRHDGQGDIGRVQRQQAFLQAILKQYMSPLNLLRTPQLLAAAQQNVTTDLTQEELLQIVGWGKDLKQDQVLLTMLPGRDEMLGGGWYWVANADTTRRVVATFLTEEEAQTARPPHQYRVAIQDGVGDRQAVRRLRQALVNAGYVAVEIDGPAPQQGQPETQIIAQNADIPGAKAMAEALGVGRVVVAATGDIHMDFTIVMGQDWTSVVAAPQAANP